MVGVWLYEWLKRKWFVCGCMNDIVCYLCWWKSWIRVCEMNFDLCCYGNPKNWLLRLYLLRRLWEVFLGFNHCPSWFLCCPIYTASASFEGDLALFQGLRWVILPFCRGTHISDKNNPPQRALLDSVGRGKMDNVDL